MKNRVIIVSIGDEILIGQINNTNAVWMAEKLGDHGFEVVKMCTIGDSREVIITSLENTLGKADLVLYTGGLGPTKDDITKQTICEFFDNKLVLNTEVLKHVEAFFAQRKRKLTELNRKQAEVPDKCTVIHNAVGTAPGMAFEKAGTHYVFMPGVPFEMQYLMKSWVLPEMSKRLEPNSLVKKTILTHGMGESFLAAKIEPWESALPEALSLAYLPSPGRVRLRLSGRGSDPDKLSRLIDEEIKKLHKFIPDLIYGYDDDTMEGVTGELLLQQGASVATAESCTGGLIAHRITEVAGSSGYFKGSVVAYANAIKSDILGVSEEALKRYGAVSEEVARQMAEGVRKLMNTDYGLSTTGIAGPGGGSKEKPVGTVWIALACPDKTIARKYQFGDHRLRNINFSASTALNMLRLELLKQQ